MDRRVWSAGLLFVLLVGTRAWSKPALPEGTLNRANPDDPCPAAETLTLDDLDEIEEFGCRATGVDSLALEDDSACYYWLTADCDGGCL